MIVKVPKVSWLEEKLDQTVLNQTQNIRRIGEDIVNPVQGLQDLSLIVGLINRKVMVILPNPPYLTQVLTYNPTLSTLHNLRYLVIVTPC